MVGLSSQNSKMALLVTAREVLCRTADSENYSLLVSLGMLPASTSHRNIRRRLLAAAPCFQRLPNQFSLNLGFNLLDLTDSWVRRPPLGGEQAAARQGHEKAATLENLSSVFHCSSHLMDQHSQIV